jgi:hypothetical protein
MSATDTTSELGGFPGSGVATLKRPATSKKERMLHKVLGLIGRWALDRLDKINDVVAVFKNGKIEVFVITKSEEYDFELSEQLTELTSPHIVRGVIGDATLVPMASKEEIRYYFDPRELLVLKIPVWSSDEVGHAHGD